MSKGLHIISDKDNVGTSLADNYKYALRDIKCGEPIIKYGSPIGVAVCDIKSGEHVHTHNIKTGLAAGAAYPEFSGNGSGASAGSRNGPAFSGYVRKNGEVGIRNDIFIIPTVGCVNGVCEKIAAQCRKTTDKRIIVFAHPYGCSQLGGDHENTRDILKGIALHPNAGGVLVVALGCENNTLPEFKSLLGSYDSERVRFITAQDSGSEIEDGVKIVKELIAKAGGDKRTAVSADRLVIGLKCGGSDALSGITANPLLGRVSDMLISAGGSVVMSEVPEMFGAEHLLMARAVDKDIYTGIIDMVNNFKDYYISHGESVGENPSPGNKKGGISTLEEKSLGCVQKAGSAPVCDVLAYGGKIKRQGLSLLNGPGNDIVACSALAAAGAHIILFTTGRGTPLGSPVPVLKVSSNTALADKKPDWIDYNAGALLDGKSIDTAGAELFETLLRTADGTLSKNEENEYYDFAVWRGGITL